MTSPTTLLPLDSRYPSRLRQLTQALPTLQVRGDCNKLQATTTVALVGSRAASSATMAFTSELAAGLATAGMVTVSGGAIGIDAAAHVGAPSATIIVLGSGLGELYPSRNIEMFESVVRAGGALISPFADDAPPRRRHFVQRNTYIAALADVVVVMEAQLRSGSLSTAHAATKLGRTVLAMPGSPGTNWLLTQGAGMVRNLSDVTAALAGTFRRNIVTAPVDPLAKKIFTVLSKQAMDAESLAETLGIGIRQTVTLLAQMTASAHVVALSGQSYTAQHNF